jgi:hypothetical protein
MKESGTDLLYVLIKPFPAVSEQSVNLDKGSLRNTFHELSDTVVSLFSFRSGSDRAVGTVTSPWLT